MKSQVCRQPQEMLKYLSTLIVLKVHSAGRVAPQMQNLKCVASKSIKSNSIQNFYCEAFWNFTPFFLPEKGKKLWKSYNFSEVNLYMHIYISKLSVSALQNKTSYFSNIDIMWIIRLSSSFCWIFLLQENGDFGCEEPIMSPWFLPWMVQDFNNTTEVKWNSTHKNISVSEEDC